MLWYWWMVLGAVSGVGLRAVLLKVREAVRPVRACSWCCRMSGFDVVGHDVEQCWGPRAEEQIGARERAELERLRARLKAFQERDVSSDAAALARCAARLRLLQVGTITTRTGSRGSEIHLDGWVFDTAHGPMSGPSEGTQRSYRTTGPPEHTNGWTLPELHAMAHGGGCRCDVVRLAQRAR